MNMGQILFGVISMVAGNGMVVYGRLFSDKPLGFYMIGVMLSIFGLGVVIDGAKKYFIQPIIDELKKLNAARE
jgi:hypothetical protein